MTAREVPPPRRMRAAPPPATHRPRADVRPCAILVTGLMLLGGACAGSGVHSTVTERPPKGRAQEGVASWYGPGFHGKRTASGEIFDMHALTAAHRTLPLGTLIEVRDLGTGRVVVARVNDRGPFVRGRIVDLSMGAARSLGIEEAGIARVRVTVVGRPLSVPVGYWVQVGAFREEERARSLAADLEKRYPGTAVEPAAEWFRVKVPSGDRRRDAEALRRALRRSGYEAFLVLATTQRD